MLTKFVQSKKSQWSSFLDTCVFAYNTSQHDSSRFTPFQLMFGRCATLPIELNIHAALPEEEATRFHDMRDPDPAQMEEERVKYLEEAKANIVAAQARQKAAYDKNMQSQIFSRRGNLSSRRISPVRKEKEASWIPDFSGLISSEESCKEAHTNWSLKMASRQLRPQVHTSSHTTDQAPLLLSRMNHHKTHKL